MNQPNSRHVSIRTVLALLLAAAMVTSACTSASDDTAQQSSTTAPNPNEPNQGGQSQTEPTNESCDDTLGQLKDAALDQVTEWGLGGNDQFENARSIR